MTQTDATRRLLKVFGIAVTTYEERTRVLLERQGGGGLSAEEREQILREAAQLTADLHAALREITNHVYQLQSDVLMQLVARKVGPAE